MSLLSTHTHTLSCDIDTSAYDDELNLETFIPTTSSMNCTALVSPDYAFVFRYMSCCERVSCIIIALTTATGDARDRRC